MEIHTAQDLYDIRDITACISGTDLHETFRVLFDGEPSPSGKATITAHELESAPYGTILLEAARTVTRQQRRQLKRERGW